MRIQRPDGILRTLLPAGSASGLLGDVARAVQGGARALSEASRQRIQGFALRTVEAALEGGVVVDRQMRRIIDAWLDENTDGGSATEDARVHATHPSEDGLQLALALLVATTPATTEDQAAARRPLLAKLGQIGRPKDLPALLAGIEASCPRDKANGLRAAAAILARWSPDDPERMKLHLRAGVQRLLAGLDSQLSAGELLSVQMAALDFVQDTFRNDFGDDEQLKTAVAIKQSAIGAHRSADASAEIFGSGGQAEQQLNALRCLLATFSGNSASDQELRNAAGAKLAQMGDRSDFDRVLAPVRKGSPHDIWAGTQNARRLAKRLGLPAYGGPTSVEAMLARARKDPPGARLLHQAQIEASLKHHPVIAREPFNVGNYSQTERVTLDAYAEGSDGAWRPVRALFKPEEMWFGKHRAFFPREVAAYDFDRTFMHTGLIPPTVEAFVPNGDDLPQLGSMQFWIEDAKTLGKSSWEVDPALNHLESLPEFQRDMSRARVFLYVANDPDKLNNNVTGGANLMNLVVDRPQNLWLIDNASAFSGLDGFGGLWGEVNKDILPEVADAVLVDRMAKTDPETVKEHMTRSLDRGEAANVARRMKEATDELRTRPTF